MRVYIARMELVAAVNNCTVEHYRHLVDAFKQAGVTIDVVESGLVLILYFLFKDFKIIGQSLLGDGFKAGTAVAIKGGTAK